MKPLPVFPVLAALAAACANVDHSNLPSVQSECVYTVDGTASAADLQQTLNDILEGRIDPCAGAVSDLSSRSLELVRIDRSADTDNRSMFRLVFHFSNPDFRPVNEP